jgi:hypothetical protein
MVEAAIVIEARRVPPSPDELADHVARMRDALRCAILTLLAVPDPDRRFLKMMLPKFLIVRDAADAYGWTPERVRFAPSPRDVQVYLEVLGWLAWYERTRTHPREAKIVKIFTAWATGRELRHLQHDFDVSERTLRRWIDDMCCVILYQHEPAFKKLFLDKCPPSPANCDSSLYSENHVSSEIDDTPQSPTAWISDGEQPSADATIPAVGEARAALIDRISRQNKRRKRIQRRAGQSQEPSNR